MGDTESEGGESRGSRVRVIAMVVVVVDVKVQSRRYRLHVWYLGGDMVIKIPMTIDHLECSTRREPQGIRLGRCDIPTGACQNPR